MTWTRKRRATRGDGAKDCDPGDQSGLAADSEQVRRFEAALSTLGRLDRDVFLAAYVDRLPDVEIARRSGLTVDQVERRIARSVVAIDRALRGVRPEWWRPLRRLR